MVTADVDEPPESTFTVADHLDDASRQILLELAKNVR